MTTYAITDEERLSPVHPGEVLLEDFMKPLGLSQYRLAHDIGVPPLQISQIVRGQRAITAVTALRLARCFSMSAEVWLRLQARYDLEMAEAKLGDRITHEVKVCERAAPYTVESSTATTTVGGGV
ncbi:MAG: HigA family addiction module antitoxin [Anaerolineae bacterium]|nr:HigA family addiction module antitoxin [Anaerolineae bacterium]